MSHFSAPTFTPFIFRSVTPDCTIPDCTRFLGLAGLGLPYLRVSGPSLLLGLEFSCPKSPSFSCDLCPCGVGLPFPLLSSLSFDSSSDAFAAFLF